MNDELLQRKAELLGSFILFTKVFYKIRTGRDFVISKPLSRESHYISIAKELTKVLRGTDQEAFEQILRILFTIPPRYGKAIAVSTPILTKEGWTVADEIKEGDYIIGSKGWTKVTGVYPQGILPAKEIIFSDNQTVICNNEHLWNVCDRYTPKFKTLKTSEIENTLYEADGRKRWKIPLVDGEYGEVEPFMDPYLLGCWLGDGHSHYAAITTMDEEIVNAFVIAGHEMRLHTHQSAGKAKTYGIVGNQFSSLLRKHGLLKNKHLPEDIFRWNKQSRLALLQGLMDTDGTCGKNGQVSFTNVNQRLIEEVGYVVNSLGGIYRIYKRKSGIQTLNIRLPDNLPPFRLERKQQYVSAGVKCSPRRFIESILPAFEQEMICFTVDAEDHLFAVGEGLILTHNTELIIHFITWALAHYPDSNFIYVSYSHTLAKKQTQTVREIIMLPEYRKLFGVTIKDDVSAKDNFETTSGGSVYATGAGGTITGRGAGIQNSKRFSGAIIIDDIHKPSEITSDTMRQSVNDWYLNTLQSRVNNPNVPIIFIGQRLHEDDLAANLVKGFDGHQWKLISIPALDPAKNALLPTMHTKEQLLSMQDKMPYEFASQYQQDPQPAGGGIFKSEWFVLLDEEPKFLETFITCDTAETDKSYNDATVFSFWGIYKIKIRDIDTDTLALHWIDCYELRIEPKDLEHEFNQFYFDCFSHKTKPRIVAIEKKSTGVTLSSIVSQRQGIQIINIERTKASGSKAARYLEMQPFVASKCISLPRYGKHTNQCLEHMRKITANDTHRHDDIADTAYDAVKIGLIDQVVYIESNQDTDAFLQSLAQRHAERKNLRGKALWPTR